MSIVTPIKFDETKTAREKVIIQRLIDIRTAEVEYKNQKGVYTDSFPELFNFLKTAKKKTVLKEGSLSDKQLEAGLTEAAAARIVRKGNKAEIIANGLENFRRDTAYLNMIESIFPEKYTIETIEQLSVIPFSNNEKFTLKVNNEYYNATNIKIPLFEASAAYTREIADEVVRELAKRGYVAERIVKENLDVPLAERARRVNEICARYGANNVLLVSIHCNAAGNGEWMNARG
jgi:hypothetical protein